MKNTQNVLDKVATAITGAMSTGDTVKLETDRIGMAVAKQDQAGQEMNAGFATVALEETPATALPLQVEIGRASCRERV